MAISIFKLFLAPNFSLNWKFWFFGPHLTKKGISNCKHKSEHHLWILHIWISLSTKFYVKLTVLIFLDQIFPKRLFPVERGRSEHHHEILHIRISLGAKFQPKLTILIFWTKFAQKTSFRSKTKKVNITIEFCGFELV